MKRSYERDKLKPIKPECIKPDMQYMKSLFVFAICLGLTACSGHSDVRAVGAGATGGACGIQNEEACQMYQAVNNYRISQGKQPLELLSNCERMAQDHAVDMVNRNFFSHDSPTETFSQRAARYGMNSYVGENIAMGSSNVTTILNMWKNSSGHNANMLNASYRSTGLGFYQGYWVQCFSGSLGD